MNPFGRRRALKHDIDEELRFHIEQATRDNIAAGMPSAAAAREARKRFGNFQTVREECREVRRASAGEDLLRDVRYALRGLRRSPGFTAVAVLSLGLGIAATTTVFSVANAVLLRPLPFAAADSLFSVYKPDGGSGIHAVSYPDYLEYRNHRGAFSEVLAWTEAPVSLNLDGRAEQVYGMLVSGNYFPMLGVQAALGRALSAEDDRTPGAHPVLMLSFALWHGRFGGDPSILGKTLKLNGHAFTVIGVAPRQFTSTYNVFAPALYIPLAMQAEVLADADRFHDQGSSYLKLTGRREPGVSLAQAHAALRLLDRQLEQADPYRTPDSRPTADLELLPVGSFPLDLRLALLGMTGLLLAIVGFVLLIACANVAGLLLARATVRQREMAVRLALGATRKRLMRQLLTESTLLFSLAAMLGLGLAAALVRLLSQVTLPAAVPFAVEARIDWRVLAFSLLLALATGILFGLAPALEAARADLHTAMKDLPALHGVRRTRLRQAFVVGQIALAMVLLVGAGLVARALQYAEALHPGRQPETLLTAGLDLRPLGYDAVQAQELYRQLTERVALLPGVEAVSLVRELAVGGGYSKTAVGTANAGELAAECSTIAPQYFRTMGIDRIAGRDFTPADRDGAPRVAIVNEALARRLSAGASALGQRLEVGEGVWAEVVGVVADGRHRVAGEAPPPFVYFPYLQSRSANLSMTLVWRQRGNSAAALAAVRGEVQALDPDVPLQSPMTLSDAVQQATLPWRVAGALARSFGLVGLTLAVLGIYGLVAYTSQQRTQEIAVRIALGARRRDVYRLVLGQGLKLALLGVAVGVVLAFGMTQSLTALLFGVSAADVATYASVTLLLVLVALAACWLPAHRASRIDPMHALRQG